MSKKEDRETLGGEDSPLRLLREELGLTQEQFCREVDVSLGAVSRCERGLTELSLNIRQMKRFEALLAKHGKRLQDMPDSLKQLL